MNKKYWYLFAVAALVISALACGGEVSVGDPISPPVDSNPPPVLSSNVSNIRTARDEAATDLTTVFAPTDEIFMFFDVSGVDQGASFEISWFALDVDGQDPNTAFYSSQYNYAGEETLFANISSTDPVGLPVGSYKSEVYLNGELVGEAFFTIQ